MTKSRTMRRHSAYEMDDNMSAKNTKDSSYHSELGNMWRFLALEIMYIVLGSSVGCTLWCLIISSIQIISLILLLIPIIMLTVILWVLDRNIVGRIILLFNTFVILLSMFWILLFNLLNALIPHSPLRMCRSFERLSDEALILSCFTFTILFASIPLIRILRPLVLPSYKLLRLLKRALIVVVVMSIIFTLLLPSVTDYRYKQMLKELKKMTELTDSGSPINRLWAFVKRYTDSFCITYKKPCPKPQQFLIIIPPLMNNRDFVAKLAATTQTGACFDFALGVTKLISDLYGYETRVVRFIGVDHVIPEVKVNGVWYVIDATYTTKRVPIRASEYARYLRQGYPHIPKKLRGMRDFDTNEELSSEHGF